MVSNKIHLIDSVVKPQSSGFGLDGVTTANETFYNNRSYLAQCGKPCIFPFKYGGKVISGNINMNLIFVKQNIFVLQNAVGGIMF